jgi:hypothetical protein
LFGAIPFKFITFWLFWALSIFAKEEIKILTHAKQKTLVRGSFVNSPSHQSDILLTGHLVISQFCQLAIWLSQFCQLAIWPTYHFVN